MTLLLGILLLLPITVTLLVRAEFADNAPGRYFFKPFSTLLVIAVAFLSLRDPASGASYSVAILAGLAVSLAGDVALMFMNQSQRAFRLGLVLFLLAHLLYAGVFTYFSGFHLRDLSSAVLLLVIAGGIYLWLRSGLGEMKGAVVAYIVIISLMVNRAVSTFYGDFFSAPQAWMIAIGAVLFYISDIFIALNRFWRPFRWNRISLYFYYGGQLLIALSAGSYLSL